VGNGSGTRPVNEIIAIGLVPDEKGVTLERLIVPVGQLREPDNIKQEIREGKVQDVVEDSGKWEKALIVKTNAKPGKNQLKGEIKILVCNQSNCRPPKPILLNHELTITDDSPVEVEAKYKSDYETGTNAPLPSANGGEKPPVAPTAAPTGETKPA